MEPIQIDLRTTQSGEPIETSHSWEFQSSFFRKSLVQLSFLLSQEDIDHAITLQDQVKSMTTDQMGFMQEREKLIQQLEAAIIGGNTDEASRISNLLQGDESFHSQEWQIYHPILYKQAQHTVEQLVQGLKKTAEVLKLDDDQLPEFMISFVQSLPYGGLNGIVPPLLVIRDMLGACGSKAYLLFLLLRRTGTDCVVFSSQGYNHAVLGVNEKARGYFKEHNGKKYYLLETTVPGFSIGQINDQYNDMNEWSLINISV